MVPAAQRNGHDEHHTRVHEGDGNQHDAVPRAGKCPNHT
jgi:hypothetical protein